jgi:hypothetical protein
MERNAESDIEAARALLSQVAELRDAKAQAKLKALSAKSQQ